MNQDEIKKRIEQIKTELENIIQEANRQIAFRQGMIAALEEILGQEANNETQKTV